MAQQKKELIDFGARLDRLEAAVFRVTGPVTDPPPDDLGRWGGWIGFGGWRPPIIPDPPPIDISRLTRAQLQLSLESIKAQRIRLDAMESMINRELKEIG